MTFYKKVDERFKKPRKLTDLCHYCEHGKDIIREIKTYIMANNLNYNLEYNGKNLFYYFNIF